MTPTEQTETVLVCTRCETVVEVCAFCEKDDCGHVICYRCLRVELRQSMAHPHVHGG